MGGLELLVVLVLGGLLMSGGSTKPTTTTKPASPGSSDAWKEKLWTDLRSIRELDDTQRYFMMLTAYGESAGEWKPTAHNDTPSEVAASNSAMQGALEAKLLGWGYPRSSWVRGSGGRFQRLWPYFGDDWEDIFGEPVNPDLLLADPYDLISALKNARALQQYDAFKAKPTVGTLRLGWYGPGAMKQPQEAERLEKYRRHARKAGLPDGIVDKPIAMFPSIATVRAIAERLLVPPKPEGPPSKPLVGPIRPADLPPNAPTSRAATTDKGWATEAWYFDGVWWIRIDAADGDASSWRWVVFDHNENVRRWEHVKAANTTDAAQYAAQWIGAQS